MRTRLVPYVTHSLVCLFFLISGCAISPPDQAAVNDSNGSHILACRNLVQSVEQAVQRNRVRDHASHRINGFPYLRSNRFLASFNHEVNSDHMFASWTEQLRQLAVEGWQYEYMNLDTESQQTLLLTARALQYEDTLTALDNCSQVLLDQELSQEKQRQLLHEQVVVPDAYRLWQRILGLYPLVSPFFKLGVIDWHEATYNTHAKGRADLPVNGKLLRYGTSTQSTQMTYPEVAEILDKADTHPLGIIKTNKEKLQRLFDTYAPVFEVDTASNDDRIGAIQLTEDASPLVDTSRPVVYQYISYTRLQQEVLPQLNYMVWFPARPKSSMIDPLGGELDGLIWRVTLLPDGQPLLFDSIHLCGCYHMLFPTQHAAVTTNQVGYEEPLLILSQVNIEEGQRVYLRVASNSHYIDSVDTRGSIVESEVALTGMDKNQLRSLASGDKNQSLYGEDGIISQSARLERFIFWPMGIPSPGAMRQPGNHATAFVGRRHFDDAFLFAPYLEINAWAD